MVTNSDLFSYTRRSPQKQSRHSRMSQSSNPHRHAILGHPPDPTSQRMYPHSNYGNSGNQSMMYPNNNNYSGSSNYQLPPRGSNRDGHQMQGMPPNKNNGNPQYGYNQPPNQMRNQQQMYGSNYYGQDMYSNYNGNMNMNSNSRYAVMDAQYPPVNPGYQPNYMDQNGESSES